MAKTEAVEETRGGGSSRMYLHEGFVEWYNEAYDADLDTLSAAEIIAAFAAKRNEYRESDLYLALREEHAGEPAEPKAAKATKATKKAAKASKATKKAAPRKATKKAAGKRASKRTSQEEESPFE